MSDRGISYDDAGVDLDAARVLTEGIRDLVHGGTTGFAGTLPMPPMRDGVLVACTDGVGTKVLLARQMGDVSGLGQDLVAMSVNDLVCTGARPLFFLDYLAVGKLDPDEATVIVGAVRDACLASGCVLLGGETAEMPGLYAEGHFDMAGFAVGAVERAEMLGPEKVQDGDVIVGIESSGIHSNGYSLVRKLVDDGAVAPHPMLLAPTRLYPADIKALQASGVELHAAAHITGGGLPENLPRVFPQGLQPVLKRDSWPQAPAIAIARMAVSCGVGINNAMGSAVNVLGDVHGGAGEQAMELYGDIAARMDGGADLAPATAAAMDAWQAARGAFVPGFGHRFHPVDPRGPRLLELVDAAAAAGVVAGRFAAIGRAVEAELENRKGKKVAMNIDGATGVVFAELGFPPALGRGLFILSRSVGVLAHAWEEKQQDTRNKGPVPPELRHRYTGPPHRDLPGAG